MEGATYYYFGIPKNPVNEAWWRCTANSSRRARQTSSRPGLQLTMALVTALKATNGDTNTNKLIRRPWKA